MPKGPSRCRRWWAGPRRSRSTSRHARCPRRRPQRRCRRPPRRLRLRRRRPRPSRPAPPRPRHAGRPRRPRLRRAERVGPDNRGLIRRAPVSCAEPMPTYLDRILDAHRRAAADDQRSLERLLDEARACGPARGFRSALAGGPPLRVIAEIKRRSPSKGDLAPGLVPDVMAKAYADGGASCLSVLTDVEFFGGSRADLAEARG